MKCKPTNYTKKKYFRSFTKTINISTNDRIVGIKIKSNKDDNGSWEIEENPLLKTMKWQLNLNLIGFVV